MLFNRFQLYWKIKDALRGKQRKLFHALLQFLTPAVQIIHLKNQEILQILQQMNKIRQGPKYYFLFDGCVQLHFFCCQNYCWYIIGLDNKKPTEPVLFKSISSVKFKNKVASIYRVKRWLNNTKELICLQSKYPITTAFFLDEGMRYLPDQCKGHSFWLWTHGMVP